MATLVVNRAGDDRDPVRLREDLAEALRETFGASLEEGNGLYRDKLELRLDRIVEEVLRTRVD